ncbi:metal ABC transporter substrate-binding protein [Agromyces binzhouensis]|uniref:Zinc ABC transporter substrate-binding protein n=1 Tax=Agromyces binzhouensis TaxID=1817495 RepID=A0A4Q2JKS5_9MICO|nr:metal ABC transporter substrate-binding protein [Agromyces binzhouensis]RXZ47179.1 zinc ABC transporter substrate-binding protein [Agromyces binzhouensis]
MPSASIRRTHWSALALGAASVTLLAGCATPGASESDGVRVVATTTQVADFAREVAGESAEVTGLLQPGQSAHSFDPSAAQLLALGEADALVVNGAGLESWIDDAVDASGFDGVLIDASTGIELEATEDDHDHDHDAEADGDGDDHGDGNPHVWTDPVLAERMVANIADGLADVPGIDADAVAANADEYTARLDALDAWIDENVATVPVEERLLVTNHDAFTYFLHAYDITFVGSVIPSFDDNAEPSAAEIDELVERIVATGVQAVFSEASISPKAAETIADEAGVAVYSGEDALYGDSLGQPGSEGETYLGSQVHNARLILESWGVTPSPSPSVLGG